MQRSVMVHRILSRYIRRLISLDDTPQRIALAFAIGVSLAFSPLLGLHTFLGLLIAFLFGLNRAAVLVGVFINNPWTLIPIYTLAGWIGGLMVGFPSSAALPEFGWREIWHSRYWVELAGQWRILKPVVLGSAVLSLLTAALTYPLALLLLTRRRNCQSR